MTYSGRTATFTPLADLDYDTAYTATITTGVKDLAGNAIEADYVWSFTTEPETPTDGESPVTVEKTLVTVEAVAASSTLLAEIRLTGK